jgi:hypothetical protein
MEKLNCLKKRGRIIINPNTYDVYAERERDQIDTDKGGTASIYDIQQLGIFSAIKRLSIYTREVVWWHYIAIE